LSAKIVCANFTTWS